MMYISFTDEEKIALFDRITDCFYKANFGRMSKNDIELMMFDIYIKKMIDINKNPDGTINYRLCSDYRISKELGITQQKVRNLKIKNQLINPIPFDWKLSLAQLTENARYDKDAGKILINIPDPNLFIEIQNYIEEQGAYIEKQLNSKVLQLRVEYYVELIILVEPDSTKRKIIKELKKQFAKEGKEDSLFDEKNIGKSLIELSSNITTVVSNITGLLSPDNILGKTLLMLISK